MSPNIHLKNLSNINTRKNKAAIKRKLWVRNPEKKIDVNN